MSNRDAGEHLATTIGERLQANNRKLTWLSDEIGMAYPTLRRKLRTNPEKLELHNIIAIAIALDMPLQDLLFPEVAA
ncbi:helix-turn-helix domain-containing protein [Lacisediminihabitans sp.]|jgi:lambda repressor-like predicted transcriptional regulator|uniref:helix-turn-helix domain-containing protein n=1 Tax=Lacisediminihabitans sp. TaxID=2787631 RepID=UPI002F94286A